AHPPLLQLPPNVTLKAKASQSSCRTACKAVKAPARSRGGLWCESAYCSLGTPPSHSRRGLDPAVRLRRLGGWSSTDACASSRCSHRQRPRGRLLGEPPKPCPTCLDPPRTRREPCHSS